MEDAWGVESSVKDAWGVESPAEKPYRSRSASSYSESGDS